MKCLIQAIERDQDFQTVIDGLDKNIGEQMIAGLTGTSRYLFMASIYRRTERTILLVTHNLNQALKAYEDMSAFLSEEEVLLYPSDETVIGEIAQLNEKTRLNRIKILSKLARGFRGVVIIPISGMRRILPPRSVIQEGHIFLQVGQEIALSTITTKLVRLGYERVDSVEKQGEFSIRGGIVDLFSITFTHPVRMEWFHDELDSIRPFSMSTQRSLDKWSEVLISPAQEMIMSRDESYQAGERVQALLQERLMKVKDPVLKKLLLENIQADVEKLKNSLSFPDIYKYMSVIYPECESFLHYVEENSLLILDEPTRIQEIERQLDTEEGEWKVSLLEKGEVLPQCVFSFSFEEIVKTKHQKVFFSLFVRQVPGMKPQEMIQVICRSMQQFHGQIHVLKAEWDRWIKSGYHVLFLASSREKGNRLKRVLEDYGMGLVIDQSSLLPPPSKPYLQIGTLQDGFEMNGPRLVVVTEAEVFTQKKKAARTSTKTDYGEKIRDYQDLKPGDYIVHVNHGIGRYLGLKTLEVGGLNKDFLDVQYAGNDKLYVPSDQIHLVQKYVGSEEKTPRVFRLGGSEWSRVKNKVRSSIQDIAEDLIKLYAQREQAKGFSFSEDTSYQQEFEQTFPYEETPDQNRSIEEIKKDMERIQPMDRLLCGDVGYGKTEVAVRAAFKATMDGKQVAILVPTTILAQQHFETFKERFLDYPVQVRVLSRFRTRKEQLETIKGVKEGTVDILIGTHRILSKDVSFHDLGLLIIDEEQRFGVKHKEKIKQLKHNIDVLTLSATPIPRTLHMSMMGVRDLSIIETPPLNRFPVQTYVLEYDGGIIREAIEREIARGGQVFFLFNDTFRIDKMAEQIRMLVPHARIASAHGKMVENQLERVMLDFLDGEIDVLVSTTIIETGVDIPNVNTLIIYNADKMGLSQLYQLRGRVGRSNRIAYSYFTYQRDKVLTEVAEKRLQAIKEFTELGSGFKIAMRDLAIRGAGNLLGAEQHGHIATVGFELYSQMLKEEVMRLQGDKQERKIDPQIELEVDAYLPSEYIQDEKQKIDLYKKFRAVSTIEQVNDLEEEIEDRFGDFPLPVTKLLRVAKIRAHAIQCGINSIQQKEHGILLLFDEYSQEKIDGQKLFDLTNREFPGKVRFLTGQRLGIKVKIKDTSMESILPIIEQFLTRVIHCIEIDTRNSSNR